MQRSNIPCVGPGKECPTQSLHRTHRSFDKRFLMPGSVLQNDRIWWGKSDHKKLMMALGEDRTLDLRLPNPPPNPVSNSSIRLFRPLLVRQLKEVSIYFWCPILFHHDMRGHVDGCPYIPIQSCRRHATHILCSWHGMKEDERMRR